MRQKAIKRMTKFRSAPTNTILLIIAITITITIPSKHIIQINAINKQPEIVPSRRMASSLSRNVTSNE
eukprot:1350348-Amorphochlora_amoeboformis.AAC.1